MAQTTTTEKTIRHVIEALLAQDGRGVLARVTISPRTDSFTVRLEVRRAGLATVVDREISDLMLMMAPENTVGSAIRAMLRELEIHGALSPRDPETSSHRPTLLPPEQELKDRLLHGRPTLGKTPVRGYLRVTPMTSVPDHMDGTLIILGEPDPTWSWSPGSWFRYRGPARWPDGSVKRVEQKVYMTVLGSRLVTVHAR